jgi:hypothetical protein
MKPGPGVCTLKQGFYLPPRKNSSGEVENPVKD